MKIKEVEGKMSLQIYIKIIRMRILTFVWNISTQIKKKTYADEILTKTIYADEIYV